MENLLSKEDLIKNILYSRNKLKKYLFFCYIFHKKDIFFIGGYLSENIFFMKNFNPLQIQKNLKILMKIRKKNLEAIRGLHQNLHQNQILNKLYQYILSFFVLNFKLSKLFLFTIFINFLIFLSKNRTYKKKMST